MRHTPDAVMLFAAGFGTRMGALTKARPKPLLSVAGKPLLDHALDLTNAVKPTKTVVNAHYKHSQIEQHLAERDVFVSIETPKILDTGGGLRHALPHLGDGPVYTGNTDAVWHGPNPFDMLRTAWQPEIMDALLLCVPRAQAIGYTRNGDFFIDDDGRLNRGPGMVYTGVQILKTHGLCTIDKSVFSLNLLWDKMDAEGRLYGLTYPGTWCDVGTPEGIGLAEAMLDEQNV
ncbi:nucleotidyltransferase family protein [Shimia sp. NS0008-38b]|uniref:nucleotidyltransferase family protein n=1 Tax=Shimia sp. NS0008-38b TaxID=3127653 RepID=UPI003102B629